VRNQPLIDIGQRLAVKCDGREFVGRRARHVGNPIRDSRRSNPGRNLGGVAGAAVDRPIAARAERNGRIYAARSTNGLEIRAGSRRGRHVIAVLGPTGLAALTAALGQILKTFFGEELLLAG
jgi:hypothetical protein